MGIYSGGFSPLGMWQVKKHVFSRLRDPPMAKKDPAGNIITNPQLIKNLYIDEYVHRLRSREITTGLETLRVLKENLWERRFKYLSTVETPDWTMSQFQKAINI